MHIKDPTTISKNIRNATGVKNRVKQLLDDILQLRQLKEQKSAMPQIVV
jgi:hypothetical protein